MVEDLPEYIQEELSELQSYFGSIEELCEHEDDIICHSGCDDMADVARYYLEETGQLGELPAHLQNYIDYAAYGRDMELREPLLSRTTAYMKSYGRPVCISFGKCRRIFLFRGGFGCPHLLERTDNMKKYEAIPVSGRWKRYSIPSMILSCHSPSRSHRWRGSWYRCLQLCSWGTSLPFRSLTGHF